MKNGKKITRIRLSGIDLDDYLFFGLVSPEPDYKISLLLNRKFRISLKHSDPVNIEGKPGGNHFSRFSDVESSGGTWSLIANRANKEFLLRRLKNIDYILITHDPERELDPIKIVSELREVDTVTGVFRIEPEILKDKNIELLIH